MSNDKFKADMARILAKVGNKAESFVRAQVKGVAASLLDRSPVDTGQFKGNWQHGNATINTDTTSAADKSGALAMARINAGLKTWKPGQMIWITNSMPYALRLEYGWSQQAPKGMVRLAVIEFKNNTSKIAAGLK